MKVRGNTEIQAKNKEAVRRVCTQPSRKAKKRSDWYRLGPRRNGIRWHSLFPVGGMIRIATIMIILSGAFESFAQDDSIRYINGMPVNADDTVRHFPQNDFSPENNLQPVPAVALPDEVRETLKQELYEGWQDSIVYYQKNTELYLVPVKYENGVKIFGLNARGESVTYDEVSR